MVVFTTKMNYSSIMFERCLYFNVNALARTVNRVWEEAYAEYGLSPAHAYMLRLVCAQPGLTQKQITEHLRLEKSTVTRFINSMVNKEYIKRESSDTDAREQVIYPTKKALSLQQKLEKTGAELYKKMQKTLTKSQLVQLVGDLREARFLLERSG